MFFDNNHKFGTSGVNRECKAGVIEIGKNCWIASNAVILKGAKIGYNCVIGAGCVVNCEIPEGSIVRQKNNLHIEKIVENDT
ncbi:MAG: DapH/DapD/GlmU-related protein [Ruminococcus sp.]|nr:DapH/DapD/GlmU-related protein [Ruminococcus sp.]